MSGLVDKSSNSLPQKYSWCTRIHCQPIHWNIFSLERDFIFGLNNLSSADDWHKNHSRIIDGYEKNAFQHQKTRNVQWCQGVPLQHVLKNDIHKKELIFCKSLKGINGIIDGWSCGLDSFTYQVTKLWNEIPSSIKDANSLLNFKSLLSKWAGPECHCGSCILCKVYNV